MNDSHLIIKDKSLFIDESLESLKIGQKGIVVVSGVLKQEPTGGRIIQSYLFDDKWDREDAKNWIEDNNDMTNLLLGNNKIINLGGDDMEERKESLSDVKLSKMFSCESKDFDDARMTFTATASTEDKDRDGDVIVAQGWKLKNYKKNPVVLWQHNADLMPIARANDVWIDEGKLKFKPEFLPADINPFARQVYLAYKKGYLTSFSVRFDPIDWEDMPQDSKDETIMMRRGRKFKKAELLEISAVNIPANPQATKSAEMIDFVVKSYLYQNKSDINLNIEEIYSKANEGLKSKIDKLFELKELKEKKDEEKTFEKIDAWVDSEIKNLEIELYAEQKKLKLEQELKELQAGITRLVAK